MYNNRMATDNKTDISYRHWAAAAPRAVFLLVHGLGAHGGRWEPMGEFFMRRGISSYAVELGNTERAEPAPSSLRDCRDKIIRLREIASSANPGNEIFIIGESMGALVSFLLAADRPELFAGLVCISPAFANRVRLQAPDYIKMFVSLLFNPRNKIRLPFDSSMCTRDPDYRKRMEGDSREHRDAPAKMLFDILVSQAGVASASGKLGIPALFLVSGEDSIADPQASAKVFGALRVKDKTLIEYPGMYHSLSVELGKETVFEDLLKWTEKRI